MVFVPGGLLVQEEMRREEPTEEKHEDKASAVEDESGSGSELDSDKVQKPEKKRKRADEASEERTQRKAEKKQRKEERRTRREAKRLRKLQKGSGTSTPLEESTETSTGASTPIEIPEVNVSSITQQKLRNGRHLLRGRNIQAKRMAFTDSKALDGIFMRQQQQQAV